MEFNLHDDKKLVTIWLTNTEKDDPTVAEALIPVYRAYKQKKYTVAVFKSGTTDLRENTSALLVHNRNKMAREEAH